MAYDFLGLVNDVNKRLNEVELDSENFADAVGFYSTAKDAVNSAINQINFLQHEWPFNHVTQEETVTAGVTRYTFPSDAKTVDMDTFRIKKSATLNNDTSRLYILSYEDYLDKFVDQEYNTDATSKVPTHVFRAPDMSFGLVPVPDKAYTVVYEYYRLPVDLQAYSDVPTIPEQFRNIIIDGAMHYAYLFRGNTQDATLMQQKFMEGINRMRTIYINRTDYVRGTMIERSPTVSNYLRVN